MDINKTWDFIEMSTKAPIVTDISTAKALATAIQAKVAELNRAILAAGEAGLSVEIRVADAPPMEGDALIDYVEVVVTRHERVEV